MQVPYNPVPSVSPSEGGTPTVQINAPEAAFGGNVAKALEGLGAQGMHAGDEIMRRALALQELKNETEAKTADAKYMIEAGKLHADFSALQGQQAADAFPKYQQDLNQIRTGIRGQMSNDMSRKMYDSSSLSVMGRTIFNGAGHAATQQKMAAFQASTSRVDLLANQAQQFPEDDLSFRRIVKGIEGEVQSQADVKGWEPDTVKDQTLRATSKAWAHRITGLSKTDPFKAYEMFEENKDSLHYEDRERVENTVRSQTRSTGARNIASTVMAPMLQPDGPQKVEKSLKQYTDEALKLAKDQFPNDDLLPVYVEQQVRTIWNLAKTSERDFQFSNDQTIQGAINNGINGQPVTSPDHFQATPETAAAWDAMDEKKKAGYLRAMEKNAKDDFPRTEKNWRRFQELRGMANSDDVEQRSQFLSMSVTDEEMPREWRGQLLLRQQAAKKDAQGDPRVQRAMNVMKPTLAAANLSKEDLNVFRGSLQDELEVFQTQNKKQPNYEETKNIGARLLQEQTVPGFVFGNFWPNKTPLYKIDVPKEEAERIKSNPVWAKNGRTPSDDDVRRWYVVEQYKKLYGGAAKGKGDSEKPQ